ncbi:MAG TPA: mannosyltransferase family protein [Solirubrobacteraceae bacterium]
MEAAPERLEPGPEASELTPPLELLGQEAARLERPLLARVHARTRSVAMSATRQDVLWLTAIYIGTRGLLLLAAYLQSSFGHHDFLHELSNWDGLWYREVANHGYLDHVSYAQTTLGFFPLFPLVIWLVEPIIMVLTGQDAIGAASLAGVLISTVGGGVTSYFCYRLATGWWGRETARKATVLLIIFPGSVVFSMVYSEGLLLPLAAACLLALERRRWLLAGLLAGVATAVQPTGLALIPVCALSAGLEWRRHGYSFATLRRVVVAPLLSTVGVVSFAVFLWLWTGSPLANYEAQHHGWGEKTDLLALVHLTVTLVNQISFDHFNHPTINLNLVVGLIGAFLLIGMLYMLAHERRRVSTEALAWTAGISFLALTSEFVPPNPRLLITAFPAVMVAARHLRGRAWTAALWGNGILLIVLSVCTFWGTTLRP